MECDQRIMLGVEEVFALQLAVLHAASGIHAARLNLEIRTPVVTSGEVNVSVASHLSNLPAIATDAFTLNPTVLPCCKISKTGACSA
jgi:hypothetical protein